MNRIEKKVLKTKADVIIDSLDPMDIIDRLIASNLISDTEIELIRSNVTRSGRLQLFLRTIKRKKNGYQLLIEIMRKANMDWIVNPLEAEKRRLENLGEPVELINMLDREKSCAKLSEKQCLDLGQFILPEYKVVGTHLGFSVADMYSMELGHQMNMNLLGFDMLVKWGQKETRKANLINLLKVFEDAGVEYDEETILKEFGKRECSGR